MSTTELAQLTPEQKRVRIAEACGVDLWVIVKRGLYYRENAGGYTASMAEAWKLPRAEAKRYEMYADRTDVPGCEKVTIEPARLPDYLNSLEAMHEAWLTLSDDQRWLFRTNLTLAMQRDPGPEGPWFECATAAHRCEAFMLTIQTIQP